VTYRGDHPSTKTIRDTQASRTAGESFVSGGCFTSIQSDASASALAESGYCRYSRRLTPLRPPVTRDVKEHRRGEDD
jgi:hypothetical protein